MTEKKKSFIEEINDENDEDDDFIVEIINSSSYINAEEVVTLLKNIYDPEISYSLYDLGLIYKIIITEDKLDIVMTLTTANCPEAQSLPEQVRSVLQERFSDVIVSVEVVFEPAWTIDNMERSIKLTLGLL